MKHLFTRFSLLLAALCISLLSYAQAQRSEVPSATAGQLATPRFKAPSTCSSCYAKQSPANSGSLQKSVKPAKNRTRLNAQGGPVAAYIRSVNIPWGDGDATNTRAMEEAFGPGNWDDLFFETTTVAEVFTPDRKFLYIDGSDTGPNEFNTLWRNNLPLIEGWVAAGGHLFLNVAPNIGSAINFGFGGVRVNYNQGPYITAVTVAAGHPIAAGPFQPAGNTYQGNYFAHGNLTGPDLVSVIAGAEGTVLASKPWGSGHVFFGSMTLSAFHTPEVNAHNLRKNILAYRVAPTCTAPVVTVPATAVVRNAPGQCGAVLPFQATASGSASISYRVGAAAISSPYQFPVGITTVTATATNACGTDSQTFTVEVRDEEAPVAIAQNVTVSLNEQGQASVTAAAVNNGSTDNCGIRSISLSKSRFTCENTGANPVTLSVEDIHGNISTASAVITVTGGNSSASTSLLTSVPGSIVVRNAPGQCNAVVPFQATASGSASISYRVGAAAINSPYQFPVGITTVTATATNACGTDSQTFTVEVQDKEAPAALAKNITITLSAQGEASLSAASINNGSTDNCGILSFAISKSSFNCQNLGPNTVVLTVRDIHGNFSTASATVTVMGSLPTASIMTMSGGAAYTSSSSTTDLYLGYGPKSLKLKAAGGVSYLWNQVAGLSNSSGEEVFFTPTRGGTYTLGVVATNAFGCQASAAITVRVVDVRCGNKNDKVLVCHNGHEICISPNAVPAHLSNHEDDQLGSCSMSGALSAQRAASPAPLEVMFEAYPNPVTENAALHFRVAQSGKARLQIFNTLGQLVTALPELNAVAGQEYEVHLSGKGLQTGMYTCRLEQGGKTYSQRMVVTK